MTWWRDGVIYQIYPRSFRDLNGDGVGDLAGVTDRLDYLEWLGVDAVWITPITVSPDSDWGYDVADYTAVQPVLGDLDGQAFHLQAKKPRCARSPRAWRHNVAGGGRG